MTLLCHEFNTACLRTNARHKASGTP